MLEPRVVVVQRESRGAFLADNIALAVDPIPAGARLTLAGQALRISCAVPMGASLAIKDIQAGEGVVSHGVQVAVAKRFISAGELLAPGPSGNLVHEAMAVSAPKAGRLAIPPLPDPRLAARTFQGYLRSWGRGPAAAGVRNLVAVMNTVKCSQAAAMNIAALAHKRLPSYTGVDGVVAITHEYGCGMPKGKALDELVSLLATTLAHPNLGGVCLVGLGCEHLCLRSDIEQSVLGELKNRVPAFDQRVRVINLQHFSDEEEAINSAVSGPVSEILLAAGAAEREELPAGLLSLGLKCGGSDRFSGVAANPVMGEACDLLLKAGGAAVITEVPEFDGYMHIMAERAADAETAQRLLELLPSFDATSRNYPIPEPGRQTISPGNYSGGLLNVFNKAAGAAAKAGSYQVEGVLEYGETLAERRGLWVLDGPSYDPISTTSLFLSGCQLVCFSTGLGTPLGSALGPVYRVASKPDTGLSRQIDYVAEGVLAGQGKEDAGRELWERIMEVASGTPCAVEELDARLLARGLQPHHEFMLWKRWADN